MAKNWFLVSTYSYMTSPVGPQSWAYFPLLGCLPTSSCLYEQETQYLVRDTLTLSQLFIKVTTNSDTASHLYCRKNAVNGNQTITIPASTTGTFSDTTHSDSLVSGDLVCSGIYTGSGGYFSLSGIAYQLQHASSNVPILGSFCASAVGTGGSPYYLNILGMLQAVANETYCQYKVRTAGTLSNLRLYVSANALDQSTPVYSRVNANNGQQSLSIGASATGSFEDTTHTDSVSAGNTIGTLLDASLSNPANSIIFNLHQYKYASASQYLGAGDATCYPRDKGFTYYVGIGDDTFGSTGEYAAQVTTPFSWIAANLFASCMTYNLNQPAPVYFRQNGANTAITISVNGTGFFEDTTHTVVVNSSDNVNFSYNATAANSGTIALLYIGVELQQPAPTTAYKNISTRFKLTVQNYKNIATRFKLTAQNYLDVSTRFLLGVLNYRDIATRFKLTVLGYCDTVTRFILTALNYQDIATRFQLAVLGYKDIASRFLLRVLTYRDIATRFKLGLFYRDIATRFFLVARSHINIATRFNLKIGVYYQDTYTRFQLAYPTLEEVYSLEEEILELVQPRAHFRI